MTYHSPEKKHYDNSLVPPNSFYSTDDSDMFARRAMSVMSSSSFQYTADDNQSIRSATLPPDNGVHLSKQDLAASLDSYENLLKAAKVYREQMQQLSGAAAGFGYALERVAKGKAVAEAGQGLQAAAGLQFLISNHQQIFGDMFQKTLEEPLRESIDHHRKIVQQSQENYNAALKIISKRIRDTESRNMKNGRKGQRDIKQFRKALEELTHQVDELDRIKTEYHRHMVDVERRQNYMTLSKVASVVRAEVDIHERIANKGLGDPMLEQMMQQNPDPFCAYSTLTDEPTEIFTVLPPVSLIDHPQTPVLDPEDYGMPDTLLNTSRSESSLCTMPQRVQEFRKEETHKDTHSLSDDESSSGGHVTKETSVGGNQHLAHHLNEEG
ncbi:related to ivy1-phospholipid-binding protein [Lichtheimia corymbifera JMRC:FSU:9682]|uniref:Related to ivy1-phospholipid-binding protein n=1 Tax=Lichtheimia corymbifera JMRC:FSU:9682 TaxID=1263082 RepID=A0A068RGY4_9FUNG|nr:related to ivy1-phospholipid-binding protein [Lichtheimia corymbifera JMRC:FSU:9682]